MTATDAARWLVVTEDDGEVRAAQIDERAKKLGIFTAREFERMTKRVGRYVPRGSITRALNGTASAAIFDRVDAALDKLEEETEPEVPPEPAEPPKVIRVEVPHVYGSRALIVQGPPENWAELEAMVDQIMRRRAAGGELDDDDE